MASVYVSGRDLPIVLEFIDQDLAEVADPVEDWCQRGEVATFKRLPTRVVINFGSSDRRRPAPARATVALRGSQHQSPLVGRSAQPAA
jgi:hypothetical protein